MELKEVSLFSLNLRGGECFFPLNLGWNVIPSKLKIREYNYQRNCTN